MSWLGDAFRGIRDRGGDLGAAVKERARGLATRAAQLEEAVVGSLHAPVTASSIEAQLESDAKRLVNVKSASELLQRWVALLKRVPQPVYPDLGQEAVSLGPSGPARGLSFCQVFLRSKAIELALETVLRSEELRVCLKEELAEEQLSEAGAAPSPGHAFAQSLFTVMQLTVGPREEWMPVLSAILVVEIPSEGQKTSFLMDLLVDGKADWQDEWIDGRRHEVNQLCELLREAEQAPDAISVGAGLGDEVPVNAKEKAGKVWPQEMLRRLEIHGRVAGLSRESLRLQVALRDELDGAVARRTRRSEARILYLKAMKDTATVRSSNLGTNIAEVQRKELEARGDADKNTCALREQLAGVEPVCKDLVKQIEEAETTQRELLRQVGALAEKISKLKEQHAEQKRTEERIRAELSTTENEITQKLASDGQTQQVMESERALSAAAAQFASARATAAESTLDEKVEALRTSAEKCQREANDLITGHVKRELRRLGVASAAAQTCAQVAEERAESRAAMEKLGVPSSTLESDIVGEAEIAHVLCKTLAAVDRCIGETTAFGRDFPSVLREGEPLRTMLEELSNHRSRLGTLATAMGASSPTTTGQEDSSLTSSVTDPDGVDPFLLGAGPPEEANAAHLTTDAFLLSGGASSASSQVTRASSSVTPPEKPQNPTLPPSQGQAPTENPQASATSPSQAVPPTAVPPAEKPQAPAAAGGGYPVSQAAASGS